MAEPILVAKDLVKHYPIKGGILRTTTGQVKAVVVRRMTPLMG